MPHTSGELLGGRYRLDDRITGGGMGEVWQARDTVLGRTVAVKTLRADRAVDPQFRSRFRHEACAMAALHHPGIADVYDFGQDAGDAYLVMAHVDGQPLDGRIAEKGRLTAAEAMAVVAQVGRALQVAHDAGIVHRDVKPGNMIVRPAGDVVLVDFGVARSARSALLTGAGEVVGTACYIAPEQVAKRAVGPAADIYALGVVAYHCLAGHPPFFGPDSISVAMRHLKDEPPPLPDDVPAAARAVVATALAKDPAARFPSAAAMAAAAERAVRPAPSVSRAVAVVPRRIPPVRRRRRHIAAAVAVGSVLLSAGAAVAATDPFDWFPGAPRPAPSAPAVPSAVPSSRPAVHHTGSSGATYPSTRTPSRSPSKSPSPSPSPSRSRSATSTPASTPNTGQASSPPASIG
ncbi:serine/threonine-protein kinase [Paractinoplanes rishiriensis]|uniref:non-specific serine/threonine protein kinase n=1 Tax=Paractinoplanes rishiriensis TaxID=1050105 RepID=A0A919K8P6_9ACTN|nr:serine/threonine-protein kinase [Actinoplanes rishiriensis]GIF01775.1 hypothetical protein Ari01nite_92390 [Actinoplanes rishiriensis]